MLKHENTPCPLPTGASGSGMDGHARRFSSVSETTMTGACENDTTDVVASIMGREFENARAQRRQTLLQKPRKKARVSIFEDGTASTIGPEMGAQRERQEAGVGVARSDLNRRQSFFARPARKGRLETLKEGLPVLGYDGVQEREQILYEEEETGGGRRDDSFFAPAQDQPAERKDGLKKNPRRRTIWVPNDDTTIMTIHPGAHTETLADPTLFASKTAAGLDMDTAGLVQGKDSSEDVTTKRMPRKSLAVAPKRVALGSLAKQQPNARLGDVVGQNGGKENLPPGGRDHGKKTITEKPAITHTFLKKSTTKPAVPTEKPSSKTPPQDIVAKPELRISRLLQPTAASQARLNESKKRNMSESREGAVRARIQPKQSVSVARSQMSRSASAIAGASSRVGSLALSRSTTTTAPVSATLSNSRTVGRVPTKLSIPAAVSTRKAQLELYPVLPNDLSRPELYEENWLSHQEVALTQLLNGLFEKAEDTDDASFPQISLRDKLLQLYQQPTFTTLHKRLQASLLYGALSLPKDAQPPNLKEDVGLRRRFLDLWLETYELDVLQSAAEVIIGRLIPEKFSRSSNSSASRSSSTTQTTSKRSLEKFLLTFLIAHDDALAADASTSTSTHPPAWHWQRTVLRSLLLLALLDHAALTHTLPTRLFRPNSPHKSSPAVLHALSTLLIPSIGDIARPLGYLDYRVTHTQYALQEHSYRVTNLAVDLRDGVLLTRLVELLLYAPTALCAREDAAADATLTLILPGGTTLTSTLNPGLSAGTDLSTGVWPLSQHLIFPAPSRAQKVYNTSIALAALRGLGGLAAAATANVRAEDVVDGHREKTLCLLWALISRWGVGLLVDWRALRWEVGRLGREGGEDVDDEDDTDSLLDLGLGESGHGNEKEKDLADADADTQTAMLKTWAVRICAARGVAVANLTSSFADGRALAAIVDAYSAFLPSPSTSTPPTTTSSTPAKRASDSLAARLTALGCTPSFTALLTTPHLPSSSTTLSLLTFLASRLLPLARTHRAACVLQRAYRLRLARRGLRQRVLAMRVADQCARVVRERDRVVGAVVAVQRRWREVLERRVGALVRDVVLFQRVARGWGVRRRLGQGGRGRGRVMGGW